jgi:hypothetical protein
MTVENWWKMAVKNLLKSAASKHFRQERRGKFSPVEMWIIVPCRSVFSSRFSNTKSAAKSLRIEALPGDFSGLISARFYPAFFLHSHAEYTTVFVRSF